MEYGTTTGRFPPSSKSGKFQTVESEPDYVASPNNILRFNQSDTIAHDRYAAALGGLKSLFAMNFHKQR